MTVLTSLQSALRQLQADIDGDGEEQKEAGNNDYQQMCAHSLFPDARSLGLILDFLHLNLPELGIPSLVDDDAVLPASEESGT